MTTYPASAERDTCLGATPSEGLSRLQPGTWHCLCWSGPRGEGGARGSPRWPEPVCGVRVSDGPGQVPSREDTAPKDTPSLSASLLNSSWGVTAP